MQIAYYLYATLLIVGGILGYVEKKSVISLVAGVVCGALSLAAATLYAKNPTLALSLGGLAALLVFGSRIGPLLKEFSLWPGGILVAASAIVLIGTIIMFVTTRNSVGAAR